MERKDHFTVELEPLHIEDLSCGYPTEVTVETDEFVATIVPPEEMSPERMKQIALGWVNSLA